MASIYLVRLVKADIGQAEDNLYRAKLAARSADPSKHWGASGETLQSIIDGYQLWLDEAKAELKKLKEG